MRYLVLLVMMFMVACEAGADPGPVSTLEEAVEAAIADHPGGTVCVAYRNLESGRTLLRYPQRVLHAASTMKVPVLYEAYRQDSLGARSLDQPLLIHNQFTSIEDGTSFALDPAEDSETDLYLRIGSSVPARELLRRMTVRSSNLATNILIEWLGASSVQRTVEALGCRDTKVLRGVEDGPAFRAGKNNVTTAGDLAILMAAIHQGEGLSPPAREELLGVLFAQEFRDMIPAGIPEPARVAHKTGSITGIRHDAGIVYPESGAPYVLVILTEGFEDPERAAAVGAAVSRAVWLQRPGR